MRYESVESCILLGWPKSAVVASTVDFPSLFHLFFEFLFGGVARLDFLQFQQLTGGPFDRV